MSQFRAIVHGRVQGVCFRAETVTAARDLGLRGYARNQVGGTVEVAAAGPRQQLEALLVFLHQGPEPARVSQVEVDWSDTTPLGDRFEVSY